MSGSNFFPPSSARFQPPDSNLLKENYAVDIRHEDQVKDSSLSTPQGPPCALHDNIVTTA
jgi:hypothetical protein